MEFIKELENRLGFKLNMNIEDNLTVEENENFEKIFNEFEAFRQKESMEVVKKISKIIYINIMKREVV